MSGGGGGEVKMEFYIESGTARRDGTCERLARLSNKGVFKKGTGRRPCLQRVVER